MLGGVLKKVLLVLLVVVAIQNWGKVERLFNPSQVAPEQVRASARVVLATEWCGYCKQIRRFLDQKVSRTRPSISRRTPRRARRMRRWAVVGFRLWM